MEIDMLLQGAGVHHALRAASAHQAGRTRGFAGAGGNQDVPCLHLGEACRRLSAQMAVFHQFKHGCRGPDIKSRGCLAKLGGKARPAPQAPVAWPAKAQMAAMARDAARHGLALKHYDIADAEIAQAACGAQASRAAADDDHIMAFHRNAPC